MSKPIPPESQDELLLRANRLAGHSIQTLANTYHQIIPPSLHQAKGFIGQLVEMALGVVESNLPEPDFAHLGIELKTLPVDKQGLPRESTYVCTAPFGQTFERWENSRVRAKLAHVLWIPVEADPNIELKERRFGMPLLWRPSKEVESVLQQDWEELSSMLSMGEVDQISAKLGTYLQLRPKAAHSRVLSRTVSNNDETPLRNPKGFYLRTTLTKKILEENYCLSNH